jgi:uncharacterized membrane protein
VSKSSQRKRSTGGQSRSGGGSQQQRREEKRAQFEAPRRRTGLHIALAVGALVVVAVVAFVVVSGRNGGEPATATTAATPGGSDVTMPVSSVNDGKAHFFTYDAGGTTVKYFVLADKTGKVRAALDACEVCYPQKKGYHQQGDAMQCNNCGKIFPSADINVITGGCNPIPVKRSVSGDTLTINVDSLQAGAQYF